MTRGVLPATPLTGIFHFLRVTSSPSDEIYHSALHFTPVYSCCMLNTPIVPPPPQQWEGYRAEVQTQSMFNLGICTALPFSCTTGLSHTLWPPMWFHVWSMTSCLPFHFPCTSRYTKTFPIHIYTPIGSNLHLTACSSQPSVLNVILLSKEHCGQSTVSQALCPDCC